MIYFSCPGCRKLGEAADSFARHIVTCPGCLTQMQVPAASTAAPGPGSQEFLVQAPPEDGKVRFLCPRCRKRQRARIEAIGGVTVCRRCHQRMYVPALGSPDGPLTLAHRVHEQKKEPSAYYYVKNGVQCGPVHAGLLRQMAKTGVLLPTDLIWKKGMSDWIAAAKLHGLFPGPKVPPPLPAKPPAPAPPAAGIAPGSALAAFAAPQELPTRPAPAKPVPAAVPVQREQLARPAPPQPKPNAAALVARGMAHAEKGDAAAALADLTEAIRLEPRNAQALASRAVVHAQLKGNHRQAITDLTEAIRHAPHEAVLHEFRGLFHRASGDVAKAAEDERRAAELAKRGPSQIVIKLP